MLNIYKVILILLLVVRLHGNEALAEDLHIINIHLPKELAPENQSVRVWYRIPSSYVSEQEIGRSARRLPLHRVLVVFGGRNCSGENEAKGNLGNLAGWADEHGIFLVAPGFKNDNYWDPAKWSGKALTDALAVIARDYRIQPDKVLFYGYSAGSQASNLFAAKKPSLARAWVSHACGVFHEPNARMRATPGLVTCGDADVQRYIISRRFVEQSRKLGVPILWKSFPNHGHDVPPASVELAKAFLLHYHQLYADDLKPNRKPPGPIREQILYVGDDQEGLFWPADARAARFIAAEDRVEFPSLSLAEAWGAPARGVVTAAVAP